MSGEGSLVIAFFVGLAFILLALSTEVSMSIEQKISRAIKVTEEIDGQYCIFLERIEDNKILDENYCLPLKNKIKIENLHESVIERQQELEKINSDKVLSRLANYTIIKEFEPRGWR